jgi:hypothetical protein
MADPRETDDAPDERRPRKKKKHESKLALWIGLGAGAAVLLVLIVVVIVVAAAGALGNLQAKGKPAADAPAQQPNPPLPPPPNMDPPPKQGTGGLARTLEVTERRFLLQQLGVAYQNHELTENRAPASRKELSAYYENNGKINDALDKGDIVFIYGVRPQQMPQGASNTILAYEAIPDRNGNRIVLNGDGSVHTMDEATFSNAPKAGKAK